MRRALLVPADVHRSAGLVVRDRLREASLAHCLHRRDTCEGLGEDLFLDTGDGGTTAPETVHALSAFAPDEIEVWFAVTHRRAADVLCEALDVLGRPIRSKAVTGCLVVPGMVDETDSNALPCVPDPEFLQSLLAAGTGFVLPATPPETIRDALPSPFSPALHLGDREWVQILGRHVAAHRIAEWRVLVQAHDCLVQPLLEVYAGRSLRDRNADLLINVV